MNDVCVSKTTNRSVVGCMNEYTLWIERRPIEDATPTALLSISMRLSRVLLGPLMRNNGPGSANRALQELLITLMEAHCAIDDAPADHDHIVLRTTSPGTFRNTPSSETSSARRCSDVAAIHRSDS